MLLPLAVGFYLTIFPLVYAVRPSSGCQSTSNTGLGSGIDPGEWIDFTRAVPDTQTRKHRLTIPINYSKDDNSPSPVLLFFHGWGGDYRSCGKRCQSEAADRGFVSVAMTGYGPKNFNSWRHGGSASSPGPEGNTCTPSTKGYCNDYSNSGCDCSKADNCWWTTCFDSVQQTLAILDEVEQNLCVDLDQIWAAGCSNGGMFTFELASDERSAPRLAGIIPIVGLPHYGFSTGPMVKGIHMMGWWGSKDTTVPPISNTNNPDKTLDTSYRGWYYTSANKVMSDWTTGNDCAGSGLDPLVGSDWFNQSDENNLSCTVGCSESDSVRVVGCIFDGGHICYKDYMWEPIFNFMLDNAPPECTENGNDNFLLKKRRNGGIIIKDCAWLASSTEKKKKNTCQKKVHANEDFLPAQDVCQSTCNSCDPCYENSKTKFFRSLRPDGTLNLWTCGKLMKSKNREKLCEELTDSYGGYGSPRDSCVVTCSVGNCSTK